MTVATRPHSPAPAPIPSPDLTAIGELRRIPLSELVESPWNPRKHFDSTKLAEMADSLKKGQLAPIIVRPWTQKERGDKVATPYYEIGAGHRRYRSAPAAGLTSLLAIVRDLDDVAFLELLTIENKQREDIAPLDEAAGFRLLMEKAGYDVAKLAARIGLSTKYVYDRIKLLQLIPAASTMLENGSITAGHAILLARLSAADQKRAIGNARSADVYSMNAQTGGLFRPEHVEGELRLEGGRAGVRSVRELQQWIHDNVRMKPESMDGFLFPETVQILAEAKENKDKVVHITYEHFCPDGAKDRNERTYGKISWKRADGRGGKKCDRSVIGHVVAGPHQGDAFRVCVNRDRCEIHWKESARRFKQRQKAAKPVAVPTSAKARQLTDAERRENEKAAAAAQREADLVELRDQLFGDVLATHKTELIATAKKRAAEFKGVSGEALEAMLDDGDFYLSSATENDDQITQLVGRELPGKWRKGYFGPGAATDAAARRSFIGLRLALRLDVDETFDNKLERELTAAAEKALKAEAAEAKALEKKPATKKAKKGRR